MKNTFRFLCRLFILACITPAGNLYSQPGIRTNINLSSNWRTVSAETNTGNYASFHTAAFNDKNWKQVTVPHNWDQYEGYRRLRHGNKHGYAWYRKNFKLTSQNKGKQYFLLFEGVGSYATVWLNGKQVGKHAGGRTTFTLNVTNAIHLNGLNILAVRADHPSMINDLPWLCGGCSDDRGWSEGSQPLGIFRPVHLIATDPVRIEPFGVHIWNDEKISSASAQLNVETELRNYKGTPRIVSVINKLVDAKGSTVAQVKNIITVAPNTTLQTKQRFPSITNPHLWSLEDPYLYTVVTDLVENGKVIDQLKTPYGIRWVTWPSASSASKQFLLNGKPVFINGTCEYEHMMGKSHAFDKEQIKTRVMQIKAAGYNAFRDAHQPHNLLYHDYWDKLGILNWTQFSAHAWYDNAEFRTNFKALIAEWVKERRNNPSVVMWGLQNESKIPEDFAKECTEFIRQLDPTASIQRPVTTCNGGEGTDWNVPQNWTGTYGGNPATYGEDLKRQLLVGEYGAWRSLDLHTSGPFQQNGILSEDRMTQLMEMKVRLAESVKDSTAGHFHWLFTSHENPGRVQGGEGFRELDRIGPVNYKGLLTPWGEPLDVFYMFRANYAPKDKEPMVYIVSHTWPSRWMAPGIKDSITVYSNCDEVELFNDVRSVSLGKRTRGSIGTHFQWDKVPVNYNVLYAEGRVGGKVVATDYIVLNHLPAAPGYSTLQQDAKPLLKPQSGYNYWYRVNCGGPDYKDENGNLWMADGKANKNTWGSKSWTDEYNFPAFYASQRSTNDPISGTKDSPLFQTFRYGMDKLTYDFPVADGNYMIDLFFTEPWYGTGGGMDCTGWRLFDVAVNGKTVLQDVDIWKEVGHDKALKKTVTANVTGGKLTISFPRIASGQAIISAIAIASLNQKLKPAPGPQRLIANLNSSDSKSFHAKTWLSTGDKIYADDPSTFSSLPAELYGAEWIQPSLNKPVEALSFTLNEEADIYVGTGSSVSAKPNWLTPFAESTKYFETDKNGGTRYRLFTKRFTKGAVLNIGSLSAGDKSISPYSVFVNPVSSIEPPYDLKPTIRYEAEKAVLKGGRVAKDSFGGKAYVQINKNNDAVQWSISPGVADMYSLHFRYINQSGKASQMVMKILAADGTIMKEERLEFPPTTTKWATVSSNTGSYINAGNYTIVLQALSARPVGLDYFEVQ